MKNRGTGIPMPCLCGTDFWKFAFSLWLGWTSTESHRKEMHRTRNVRGSGVSVVPRTDSKTEGKQPNNRGEKLGTENTGSKGTRDEMRRMNV